MPYTRTARRNPSLGEGKAPESINRTAEEIKAVKASLFYLPSIGSRAEIEAGMAGMRPELYQRMLAGAYQELGYILLTRGNRR